MKPRIFKKICKKSAEIIGLDQCEKDGGIWYACWEERGMDYTEYDSEEAWDWLVKRFDAEINTVYGEDLEYGISWKPDSQIIKATPKNVFEWARKMTPEQVSALRGNK